MAAQPASRRHIVLAFWLCYVALVALVSLWPLPPGPQTRHWDKVVHLGMYLVMGLAVPWPLGRGRAWWSLLLLAAVGASLEAAQGLMGLGRHADLLDELANTAGAALGLGLRAWLAGRGPRPGRPWRGGV